MDFRFVAYDPQTGTKLYQLPRANSVSIGDTFGTRGTLELTYSAKAVNARDLPTFLEVQAEVTFDEGHNWAPAGPSLLRLSGEHEDTDQAGMRTLRFVGREWVLGKARVGNGDLELIDGKRPFYRASPGQILRTLILEAQDRGAADGIEIGNFTAAKDSSGKAWAKVATIYYSPGLPIGSVLENLVEQGMCDYRMNGRTIELFDPETTMGRDLTTGNNPVRVHGAVTEAPVKYTLEDLANSALLMGDEGFELEVDNPTAPDDYGRLEVTIEQGGVSDSGTARLMVDEALHRGSREVREITRSQSAAGAAFLPLRDYRVGDYVQVHTGGAWERYRVREIQLARDGDEWTIHTIINDRLQELLLKLAKRTSGIVNGSKGSGGDGTRPTPPEKPGIEPAAPEGLVIDQQVYLDRQGIARGQVAAGWGAVTDSTKGQAVEIGGYELWWRRNETQETWTRVAVTDGANAVSHSPVVLTDTFGNAMEYQWRVRAIAEASTRPGPFSDTVTLTMTQDTEPPNTPSLPVVSTDLRIITVDVDGLDEFGEAMPVDFNHHRIYFAAAEDMAGAEMVGTLSNPGSWNSGSMTPDVPVWVAVSAVDHVGNESAMTAAQSVTPKQLVDDSSIRDELGRIDGTIDDAVRDLRNEINNIVIDDTGAVTYWTPTKPDETFDPAPKAGDLWFDTSVSGENRLHRFDGQEWVSASDKRIQSIQDAQDQFGQDITEAEQRAIDEARDLANQARDDALAAAAVDATEKADSAQQAAETKAAEAQQAADDALAAINAGDAMWEDPGFEFGYGPLGSTNDAVNRSQVHAYQGSWSMEYTTSGTGGNIYPGYVYASVTPGRTYRLSAAVRSDDGLLFEAWFDQMVGSSPVVREPILQVLGGIGSWATGDAIQTVEDEVFELRIAPMVPATHNNTAGQKLYLDNFALADITDAYGMFRDAMEAASNAQTTAGEAKAIAEAAVGAAEGGNTNFFNDSPPSGVGSLVGDRWFQRDAANAIIGMWLWDGDNWIRQTLNNEVIGNLDAGKITFGYMNGDRIEAGTIYADRIISGLSQNMVPDPGFASPEINASRLQNNSSFGGLWGIDGGLLSCDTQGGSLTNNSNFPLAATSDREAWSAYPGMSMVHRFNARVVGGSATVRGTAYTLRRDGTKAYTALNPSSFIPITSEWQEYAFTAALGQDILSYSTALQVGKDSTGVVEFSAPFSASTVGTTVIEDDAITTGKIRARAVGADAIAAGVVDAEHIIAGGIQADSVLIPGSVGGTLIEDGAITTDKILAGAITAESGIVSNLSAGVLTSGTIDAARIGANTITSDKLIVGGSGNLLANTDFAYGWSNTTSWSRVEGEGIAGTDVLRTVTEEGVYGGYLGLEPGSARIQVKPGQKYRVRVKVRFESGAMVTLIPPDSALIYIRTYARNASAGDYEWASPSAIVAPSVAAGSWTTIEGVVEIPEGSTEAAFGLYKLASAGSRYVDFAAPEMVEAVSATLIEDGAITTDKILANAITAGKIAALAIEADHISANAITADKIHAGAIDGKLITGARIRTAASGARVELNSEGLKAYRSNGAVVLNTDTSDGSIGMVGRLTQTIGDSTITVGGNYNGGPGIMWSDSNIYEYPPGIRYGNDFNDTSVMATLIQGPGMSDGSSYLNLMELGDEFDMRTWKGTGSSREDWRVQASMADNRMRVGSSTSDAPYMYFKRGSGDTGQAYFAYRHPNGDGYSALTLKDSSASLYAYNWQGTRMGRLIMDAGSTELSAGTRSVILRGNKVGINSDNGIYLNDRRIHMNSIPNDSDAVGVGRIKGRLYSIYSSRRYKLLEEPIETTVESFEDKLLSVDAKTWIDKTRAERIADYHTAITNDEDPAEPLDEIGGLERIPGVIAEDLHDAGLEVFVRYDGNGEPQSVAYDRIGPALIPIIRRLRDRVDALETKLGETA